MKNSRIGAPPPDIILPPPPAPMEFQAGMQAKLAHLIKVLEQHAPTPSGKRWESRYNAKHAIDMAMIRSPSGAITGVTRQWLYECQTAADWDKLARSVITFCLSEEQAVREAQQVNPTWRYLNKDNPNN